MEINDFIKHGGMIEDVYLSNIDTLVRIPINPLDQDLADFDQINPDIQFGTIDPTTKHLELIKVIDPKRPTVYFTSFANAKTYIQSL